MVTVTCKTCSQRRALTLVEVVAAIAILGTVLVGVVLAKSRHTRQVVESKRMMAAIDAADDLILHWWTSPEGVPANGRGVTGKDGAFTWETNVVENVHLEQYGVSVVRVTVSHPEAARLPTNTQNVLVTVDLVVAQVDGQQSFSSESETDPKAAKEDHGSRSD